MRYLLIEDAVDLAQSVKELLRLGGHAVDWSASLAEAGDCLAGASYDLILLDIALPDGDGRQFLSQLRRQGDRRARFGRRRLSDQTVRCRRASGARACDASSKHAHAGQRGDRDRVR